jgi:hypothetical protein
MKAFGFLKACIDGLCRFFVTDVVLEDMKYSETYLRCFPALDVRIILYQAFPYD